MPIAEKTFLISTYLITKVKMALYDASIELTPANFDLAAKKYKNMNNKPGLIMFYAHWCPHCTTMVDTWKQLNKSQPNHTVRAIDCALDANAAVGKALGISGYPTIKKVDASGKLSDYEGARDLNSLKMALNSGGQRGGARRRTPRKSPRKSPRRVSPRRKSLKTRK